MTRTRLIEETGVSSPLLFGNFPAPGNDLGFGSGGFGFLDVAGAIVKKRKTGPADLVVRLQFHRAFAGLDRFLEPPELHQRHAERVPAIEKVWIELYASLVLLHRAIQVADSDVAAGVVKNFGGRLHLLSERPRGTTNGSEKRQAETFVVAFVGLV